MRASISLQLVKEDVLQYFNSFGRVKCASYSDGGKQWYKTDNVSKFVHTQKYENRMKK